MGPDKRERERERDYDELSLLHRRRAKPGHLICFLVHFLYLGWLTFSPIVNRTLVHLEVNRDPGGQEFGCLVHTRVRLKRKTI